MFSEGFHPHGDTGGKIGPLHACQGSGVKLSSLASHCGEVTSEPQPPPARWLALFPRVPLESFTPDPLFPISSGLLLTAAWSDPAPSSIVWR